jgi:hypothetical protein
MTTSAGPRTPRRSRAPSGSVPADQPAGAPTRATTSPGPIPSLRAKPVDDGPVDDGPVDDGPVDDGPVDDGPVDDGADRPATGSRPDAECGGRPIPRRRRRPVPAPSR